MGWVSPLPVVASAYIQRHIEAMLTEAEATGNPLGSEWDPMRQLAQTLIDLAEPALG